MHGGMFSGRIDLTDEQERLLDELIDERATQAAATQETPAPQETETEPTTSSEEGPQDERDNASHE